MKTKTERVKKPKVAAQKEPVPQAEPQAVDEVITRKLKREVVIPAHLRVVYLTLGERDGGKVRLLTDVETNEGVKVKRLEAGKEKDVEVKVVAAAEGVRVVEVDVSEVKERVELKVTLE